MVGAGCEKKDPPPRAGSGPPGLPGLGALARPPGARASAPLTSPGFCSCFWPILQKLKKKRKKVEKVEFSLQNQLKAWESYEPTSAQVVELRLWPGHARNFLSSA